MLTFLVASLAAGSFFTANALAQDRDAPPTPEPGFFSYESKRVEKLSQEEDAKLRATAEAESDGYSFKVTGKETAGRVVDMAGKTVQLTGDTWVEGWAVSIFCLAGTRCPAIPIVTLVRGDSSITIDGNGEIWEEKIASGAGDPFAYVKDIVLTQE